MQMPDNQSVTRHAQQLVPQLCCSLMVSRGLMLLGTMRVLRTETVMNRGLPVNCLTVMRMRLMMEARLTLRTYR